MDGCGWKARGDFVAPESSSRHSFFPRLRHLANLIPIFLRFVLFSISQWWNGRGVFIDIFRPLQHKPIYGVPCGAIGTGSVGRDFRGGFCKLTMLPGLVEQRISSVKADQFIVSVRSKTSGQLLYQKVLNAAKPRSKPLGEWEFGFPAKNLHFRGLYPRSWTKYEIPEVGIDLICRQVSPVFPNDYKVRHVSTFDRFCLGSAESFGRRTLRFHRFHVQKRNRKQPMEKENLCRFNRFESSTCTGINLKHSINGIKTTYGLSSPNSPKSNISKTTFDPSGNGRQLWDDLKTSGAFQNDETPSNPKELGIAICSQQTVAPKETEETRFCLVWHQPMAQYGMKIRSYRRRYTRFFQEVEEIASYAFERSDFWEEEIEKWQNRVLQNPSLPDWYKSALFNELYFVTDGGSCWVEFDERWSEEETQMSECTKEQFREYGRFAYLESWEYFMINTYDVHFYASFALLENWPQLQLSTQLDFCDQVLCEDKRVVSSLDQGSSSFAKRFGRLPHDLGHPRDEPFVFNNTYMLHDTGNWRDLNLKFILMSYRDFVHIVDKPDFSDSRKQQILKQFYDPVVSIINTGLSEWDTDGDLMIENSGTADQTYDIWRMNGTSAYCGGLWLAAVFSAMKMAEMLRNEKDKKRFEEVFQVARKVYVDKLWNGKYFDFDEFSENRNSIMADQLCGVWFASMILGEHPEVLVDREKAEVALKTVYEFNVMKFAEGRMGPVNGMKPDGSIDISSLQSEEVWTGVGYALGSYMIMIGMLERGFHTAEGIYRSCWEQFGLHYQTPEAFMKERDYRAIGYMRPLSVWAMQRAIDFKEAK
ncbi:hypothetical protein L596_011604 [Steinernema carpocapsae]|uniref:Glucosylceramidase n=1 Tax=Steinernema carpocapsae TaxID=34508 RepID=A0A4V6A4J1_STECR|nr:hypothetical protein L596_011604 [Steinernema carpocapsae]